MIFLKPIIKETIWGGEPNKINFKTNKKNIGEVWFISGVKGNESKIVNNELNLNEFYKKYKKTKFNNYHSKDFPLLSKIINAKTKLSIQVHPDDKQAKLLENRPFGKSECWLILDAPKNGKIIVGTKAKNKKELENVIKNNKWEKALNYLNIKKGDLFNIEPGTIHAICEDTIIFELQQSSDTTYRLYDYDRKDFQGNLRELHIEKSLKVINFKKSQKQKPKITFKDKNLAIELLINNKFFNLERWHIDGTKHLSLTKDKNFLMITNLDKEILINNKKLKNNHSLIITSDELENINLKGKSNILVGYPK